MIRLSPATPIVKQALNPMTKQGNGPWQETIDLINSYMWACFVALGGGDVVMLEADRLHPVDDLRGECELLIRKASNWSARGAALVNPKAARLSLIDVYRLSIRFGLAQPPTIIITDDYEEVVLIDLEALITEML